MTNSLQDRQDLTWGTVTLHSQETALMKQCTLTLCSYSHDIWSSDVLIMVQINIIIGTKEGTLLSLLQQLCNCPYKAALGMQDCKNFSKIHKHK